MSKKKDDAWKRFNQWIETSKKPFWQAIRNYPPRRTDEIRRAAEAFGLDHQNPADRDMLLGILAHVHFPSPSALAGIADPAYPAQRGAPKKHTNSKIRQLRRDICEVCPGDGQYPATHIIAKRLQATFPSYGEVKLETLNRHIRRLAFKDQREK